MAIMYSLREDIEGVIRSIFKIADQDDRHQVLDALNYDSVRSWKQFTKLIAEDIPTFTMEVEGGKRVAISRSCMKLLLVLTEMIDDKGRDISLYNRNTFAEYFYSKSQKIIVHSLMKQGNHHTVEILRSILRTMTRITMEF